MWGSPSSEEGQVVLGITSPRFYIPAPLFIRLQSKDPPCLGLNFLTGRKRKRKDLSGLWGPSPASVLWSSLKIACPCVLLTPVSFSTDIMVDTPDEQSIVTYVAQFLEHFPELEAVCCFSLPLILIVHFHQTKPGRGGPGAIIIQN